HRPRLLFLDEPTTGLDPQARMAVWDLVDGLRAEGLGVVLTSHYMDEAERLSDALTVLAAGRVVARGTPKAVLGDLVGEHVVVVDVAAATAGGIVPWLAERRLGAYMTGIEWRGRTVSYLSFVAPGMLAYAAFMTPFFQALYSSFIRMHYQRTWEGQLTTQIEMRHVVWGELLWAAVLGTVYATIVSVVLALFHVFGWLTLDL